jgi:hypothetical protein
MEEKAHILKILKKTKALLQKKDYMKIKSLSNKVIHNASINQESDVILIAVVLYALSKLLEREDYRTYKEWPKFYKDYTTHISHAITDLEKDNMERFREEISSIRKIIEKLPGRFQTYVKDVFRRAQVNKASRIYEHGISMRKTAKILGVSVWELAEYAGGTGIGDVNLSVTMPIRERVKMAEEIFEK